MRCAGSRSVSWLAMTLSKVSRILSPATHEPGTLASEDAGFLIPPSAALSIFFIVSRIVGSGSPLSRNGRLTCWRSWTCQMLLSSSVLHSTPGSVERAETLHSGPGGCEFAAEFHPGYAPCAWSWLTLEWLNKENAMNLQSSEGYAAKLAVFHLPPILLS